jgi:hypothetical protein
MQRIRNPYRAILGPSRPPLTREQLADFWTKKNVPAFAQIAMRSMIDPVGTVYEVPPLRVVVFASDDARILYQLRLHKAVRDSGAKNVVERAICRHIEELALFCRAELLALLSKVDLCATFQEECAASQ